MRDESHFIFTQEILKLCRLNEKIAFFSSLPFLARQKSLDNYMFTQPLSHLPDLIEVAIDVFNSLDEQGRDIGKTKKVIKPKIESLQLDFENSTNYIESFYYRRKLFFYQQTSERVQEICDEYTIQTGEKKFMSLKFLKENEAALLLSFVSYVYFDLWLGPRQLFFPASSYCSGSWDLWNQIDYLKFLEEFQKNSSTNYFSKNSQSNIWNEPLDHFSLIKAMIIRMGEKSSPPINYSIIDRSMRELLRFLGLNEYKRIDAELEFLLTYEHQQEVFFKELFNK